MSIDELPLETFATTPPVPARFDLAPLIEELLARIERRRTIFRATYRFQFTGQCTFAAALEQIPYLHELGISHLYASPYLKARPNSAHGYDVCEHDVINPELGGEAGLHTLVTALREHGMGHIVDIVPNHTSATTFNPLWADVLENGRNSPYSNFFDIDWEPVKEELHDKVLLPILGQQYGDVLEGGQLILNFQDGGFTINYFDNRLPIGSRMYLPILSHNLDDLRTTLGPTSEECSEYESILNAIGNLPRSTDTLPHEVVIRQREKEIIKRRLRELCARSAEVEAFVQKNVTLFNGVIGDPSSFDQLDSLLNEQPYRLCHWRAASDEINYRRFFDINELAALSMELPEVFLRTHTAIARQLAAGKLDGVRIDHIDGLLAPEQYLWRLQWMYLAETAKVIFREQAGDPFVAADWQQVAPELLQQVSQRLGMPNLSPDDLLAILGDDAPRDLPPVTLDADAPPPTPNLSNRTTLHWPLYVVVEKILGAEEPLPESWPTAGTTGYDFLTTLGGLFISRSGLKEITRTYDLFLKEHIDFDTTAAACKQTILKFAMSSELQMLAQRVNRISEQHRRSRDYTLNTLRHVLREILVCFPVYRTYPGPGGVSDRDRRFTQMAVARAKRKNPTVEPAAFDFIQDLLLLKHPPGSTPEAIRERELFAGRFQQVTSPVMAKGVEDTAFYVYCPLASANEVGGEPRQPVRSVEQFHRENIDRSEHNPFALLATSTHDTKRSEDVRSRITVLSEIPSRWRKRINHWSRTNRALVREIDGLRAPSRNDEYLFYQTLVGAWPIDVPTAEQLAELTARMQQYMEKASHEAKQRTSWITPNVGYDAALREFIAGALAPTGKKNRFLTDFVSFHEEILDYGLYTALSQTTLKLTSPGVPDIYQGQELWDFSLVDPDNRRPVDYSLRRWLLGEVRTALTGPADERTAFVSHLGHHPRDSRSKLIITSALLQLRGQFPDLFTRGRYLPLQADGSQAGNVVSFARQFTPADGSPQALVVVVPRSIARLMERLAIPDDPTRAPLGERAWEETTVSLSEPLGSTWTNVFTGASLRTDFTDTPVADLLNDFPVAVLLASERSPRGVAASTTR